jgi:hypothetical protein
MRFVHDAEVSITKEFGLGMQLIDQEHRVVRNHVFDLGSTNGNFPVLTLTTSLPVTSELSQHLTRHAAD